MSTFVFYLIAAGLLFAAGGLAGFSVFSSKRWVNKFMPFLMASGLIASGGLLYGQLFRADGFHFGFSSGLVCVAWLAAFMALIESFFKPFRIIDLIVFPLCGLCLLLLVFVPQTEMAISGKYWLFGMHIVLAVFAHSLLGIAVIHAGTMVWLERSIQQAVSISKENQTFRQLLFDQMPSLMALEATLFRQITLGFVLLTLALGSGFVIESINYESWYLDHKTALSVLAWVIFAVLLAGRFFMGWRGKRVIFWCLGGYAILLLAYFGTQFIVQFVF